MEQRALQLLPPAVACPGGPPAYLPSAATLDAAQDQGGRHSLAHTAVQDLEGVARQKASQMTASMIEVLSMVLADCSSGTNGDPSVAVDLAAEMLMPPLLAEFSGVALFHEGYTLLFSLGVQVGAAVVIWNALTMYRVNSFKSMLVVVSAILRELSYGAAGRQPLNSHQHIDLMGSDLHVAATHFTHKQMQTTTHVASPCLCGQPSQTWPVWPRNLV